MISLSLSVLYLLNMFSNVIWRGMIRNLKVGRRGGERGKQMVAPEEQPPVRYCREYKKRNKYENTKGGTEVSHAD